MSYRILCIFQPMECRVPIDAPHHWECVVDTLPAPGSLDEEDLTNGDAVPEWIRNWEGAFKLKIEVLGELEEDSEGEDTLARDAMRAALAHVAAGDDRGSMIAAQALDLEEKYGKGAFPPGSMRESIARGRKALGLDGGA